jgi:hypothetical protein
MLFPKTLCFILILSVSLSAQHITIDKGIDSNLFLLKDGRRITLVNVETPSLSAPDSAGRIIAGMACKFAQQHFLHKALYMEIAPDSAGRDSVVSVHLMEKFPLSATDFNVRFLENGFGSYRPDPASLYHEKYSRAQQKAVKKKRGIWQAPEEIIAANIKSKTIAYRISLWGGRGNYDPIDGQDDSDFYEMATIALRLEDYYLQNMEMTLYPAEPHPAGVWIM